MFLSIQSIKILEIFILRTSMWLKKKQRIWTKKRKVHPILWKRTDKIRRAATSKMKRRSSGERRFAERVKNACLRGFVYVLLRQLVTYAIITFLGPPVHASLPFVPAPRPRFPRGPISISRLQRETLSPFTGAWKMRVLLAAALLAVRIYVSCPMTDTF